MAREALTRKRNGTTASAEPAESTEIPGGILSEPGWASHDIKREKSDKGKYPRYSIEDGTTENLVKFVQDGYFTAYLRHWPAKYPLTCSGDGCPLCAKGDRARPVYLFNVIDMTGGDEPELKVWEATSDPFRAIKLRAEDAKYSPINRDDMYFSVTKVKEENSNVRKFSVDPVKSRDLQDDFGIDPLTDTEFKELSGQAYTKDIVWVSSSDELSRAAEALKAE